MSLNDCIKKVNKALANKRLTKRDVEKLLQELDTEARKLEAKGDDYAETMRDFGKRLSEFTQRAKREEKRRALLQMRSRQQLRSKYERLTEQGMTSRQAILSMMVGLRRDGVSGSMNSTSAKQTARSNKNMNEFVKHLEAEGVLSIWRSKDENTQLAILEAIEKLNTDGADAPKGDIGKIAQIYQSHNKRAREQLRKAGVDTRNLDGFSITQSHDPSLMQMAGPKQWKKFVIDLLDYDRIFGTTKYDAADIEAFLDSAYGSLVSGVRIRPNSAKIDDITVAMPKPRNMAESMAGSRVIHFKDTANFFKYNQKFGRGSSQQSMIFSLRSAGFYSALLEDFGPNPRANFERLIKDIKADLKVRQDYSNIKDIDKQGFWQKMAGSDLEALFNNIDGTAFIAVDARDARIAQNIRGWVSMSRLGAATISAISDNPIMAKTLADNGVNHASGYIRSFAASIGRLPPEQRQAFASMIDTYQEVLTGSLANRMGLFDEQPGKMNEAMRLFYKANLLEWWTNAHKEAMSAALTENLAKHLDLSYADLGNKLGNQLKQFDITEAEWNIMRKIKPQNIAGKEHFTTNLIDELEFNDIAKFDKDFAKIPQGKDSISIEQLSKKTEEYKQRLTDKLDSYFIETVNTGVVTPGARERAIQNWGLQPGTPLGELVRTVMLFKSFPLTFSIKVLKPAVARAGKGDVMDMLGLIVGMSTFGAVAMSAKDVLKGRDPLSRLEDVEREPKKAFDFWTAAALQGGGLGIYGDFLFGKFNRVGGSLTNTLAGPVYGGMLTDIGRVYSDITDTATGEKDLNKLGSSIVGRAKNYIPGGNLPYVAPALNYLLIYQMQEAMNPGFVRRMEKRMESQQGIKFLREPFDLRPSRSVGLYDDLFE